MAIVVIRLTNNNIIADDNIICDYNIVVNSGVVTNPNIAPNLGFLADENISIVKFHACYVLN